jgi:hypothetical protein
LRAKALQLGVKRRQGFELRFVAGKHTQLGLEFLAGDNVLQDLSFFIDESLMHAAAIFVAMIERGLPCRKRVLLRELRGEKAAAVVIGMPALVSERQQAFRIASM